jgi:acetylornithine/succinyldiaminopimelate/putrescine aminotransferase
MGTGHPLFDTWDQILEGEIPNFLRLYVNPHVAQACFCLSRYVQDTWHRECPPEYQTFLANGFDEALSGAIKLARFCAAIDHRSRSGLVIDPKGRMGPLASVEVDGLGRLDFIPDLAVTATASDEGLPATEEHYGFVVLFAAADSAPPAASFLLGTRCPLVIVCVDRPGLARCQKASTSWRNVRPDIVVFDESFVHKHVPFGAFTARKVLYNHWNRRGFTAFHSTTYQPNTLASFHFLRCLEKDDPEFLAGARPHLERLTHDAAYRKAVFARLYNPALARATAAVGWDAATIRAAGHYLTVNGRQVFDGVAGVACSIRGHNPPGYRQEIERQGGVADYHQAATERLERLTGLGHFVPAVSGASAVESALRLGLVAQFPRKYVLAFRGGFGGKTLLALTGTANAAYKRRLDPLYEHVVYIDPFAESAIEDLEAALETYPVGVVELELVQAVGGVRAMPERVVQYLQEQKRRWGYLLFVDEVQTGMYRTGPLLRCRELGIEPDLVTIGKGTSDMMFPFGATLYSQEVHERLAARRSNLPEILRERFDYEFGYKTLLNVLDRAEEMNAEARVRESGALFHRLLTDRFSSCRAVRDIRVFGLLIGIELEARRGPWRWFKKQAGSLYVLSCLRHEPFAVFLGYCQYEPHVLKLTPPLSITPEEVHHVCGTIADVLHKPAYRLLPSFGGALMKSLAKGRWEAFRNRRIRHVRLER